MASAALSDLLRLPPDERAQLAIALWESLSPGEREAELELSSEEAAEFDRRWQEHLSSPHSAVPWDEVRQKLLARE